MNIKDIQLKSDEHGNVIALLVTKENGETVSIQNESDPGMRLTQMMFGLNPKTKI